MFKVVVAEFSGWLSGGIELGYKRKTKERKGVSRYREEC